MASGLGQLASPQPVGTHSRPSLMATGPQANRARGCPLPAWGQEPGAQPGSQAALGWGLHGVRGKVFTGSCRPLSPAPVRVSPALAAPPAGKTLATFLSTKNSGVWLPRSVPRGAAGGRLWPGHGEPSGTRPRLARTPISACLRPPASTKRVPTVYLGEGNHRPCPAHPRKATGAGARSGATKDSCRLEPVLRGWPWGRLPPSTRWVSAGGSWPRSGPWLLPWLTPNTQVRLTLAGFPRLALVTTRCPRHSPKCWGGPSPRRATGSPEAFLGSRQAECACEQLQQLSPGPWFGLSCSLQIVGVG